MDLQLREFELPGDLLDVLRTDSVENLLDIDGLADFLDNMHDNGQNMHPFLAAGQGMLAPQPKGDLAPPPRLYQSSSDGTTDSSNHTVVISASGPGMGPRMASAGSHELTADTDAAPGKPRTERKKRSRNQQQMQQNRESQQKYRERKKMENKDLQHAVDMLTAELAAMRVLELRAAELETQNDGLVQQVGRQQQQVQHLRGKVADQEIMISAQAEQINGQLAMLTSQQKMILDQHQRLQLQEEIIVSLKDRLRENVDAAWDEVGSSDPTSVCRRMHQAVRNALIGAKDMEGLQETLSNLPEHLVVEICKNILCACRDMWPDLAQRLQRISSCNTTCATAAGPLA